MTEQSPVAPQADDDNTAAERAMLRAAGRDGLILVAGLAVLGSVVGYLAVGLPGVWGALIGAALAGLFCGATVLSMMLAVGRSAVGMGALVMGGWLAKMVILVVVLAVLSQHDFYDRWVLMAVVLVGAVGSAVLDYRAVKGGRVTYVQPDAKA